MKSLILTLFAAILISGVSDLYGQRTAPRRPTRSNASPQSPEIGKTGTIVDETLSLLRSSPTLFAPPIHRMRLGRKVKIVGISEADGVRFFRVLAPPSSIGWVQSEAVFGTFRPDDDVRMTRLINAMTGFEQLEAAILFPQIFPKSPLVPKILLMIGDLAEDAAIKLSRDAASRLKRGQMAATGAPFHSYFLNYVGLDRYRKIGIIFLFNPETKKFYYEGSAWKEVIRSAPNSPEAAEAQKRIDILRQNMAQKQKTETSGNQP